MGSLPSMRTFAFTLTLALLAIHAIEAKVASCFICDGDGSNSVCAQQQHGSGEPEYCGLNGADGCIVSRTAGSDNTYDFEYWVRGCCNGDECHNVHETWAYSGELDQTWCADDSCNVGDPYGSGHSKSAGPLVPTLTLLIA